MELEPGVPGWGRGRRPGKGEARESLPRGPRQAREGIKKSCHPLRFHPVVFQKEFEQPMLKDKW